MGVPRSTLAEVHRKVVHLIVEDEVDGQEETQDDKREDGQQREGMWRSRRESNTQHERMRMV